MDLPQILDRFVEGLVYIDEHCDAPNVGKDEFLPGVKTMPERQFVGALAEWWKGAYPHDFSPSLAIQTEIRYPSVARARCDLEFTTDGDILSPEWWVEVKHISLVGNNGKRNDFGVGKLLSPYLKDRSLIHDIERLRDHGLGRRRAVVGYCFGYDFATCLNALTLHPAHGEFIENIRAVCKANDPQLGQLSARPMVEFADTIFQTRNLVNPVHVCEFRGAWRHPCGGSGHVWGWELKP